MSKHGFGDLQCNPTDTGYLRTILILKFGSFKKSDD